MFHQTPATALGFYTYDKSFDKLDGLYNAIYYNNTTLLEKYKSRYSGIKFVIAPDYSLYDDIWEIENENRFTFHSLQVKITSEANEERIKKELDIDFFVAPNGKALPKEFEHWIGSSRRTTLQGKAKNPRLQNVINQFLKISLLQEKTF